MLLRLNDRHWRWPDRVDAFIPCLATSRLDFRLLRHLLLLLSNLLVFVRPGTVFCAKLVQTFIERYVANVFEANVPEIDFIAVVLQLLQLVLRRY